MTTHNLEFEPIGKKVECAERESVLACVQQNGIGLNSICGGQGTCHSCKIQLVSGNLSKLTDNERETFSENELDSGWRLACMSYPRSHCRFNIPAESMTTMQRMQVEGIEVRIPLTIPIAAYKLNLSLPTISDLEADVDRMLTTINREYKKNYQDIEMPVLKELSPIIRLWQGQLEAIVRDSTIIAVKPIKAKKLGLAVDIGSTKIAAYLVDLENGQTLAAKGTVNPQISFGDDIISRITNSIKTPEVGKKLHEYVIESINHLAEDLCDSVNARTDDILEATVAGNTVMHHMFLGLPVQQLAVSPFIAAVNRALDIKARDIGLQINPGAYIYTLPNIAGFVGGDHIAMLLGIDTDRIEKPTIAMDIGTNTEISIIYNGKITCASCASGPAFEGGHIKNGMRAASGAIERVKITGENISYQVIDNNVPIGICGSGILDAIAQMYLAGILDNSGRILTDHQRVRIKDGTAEFVLLDAKESKDKNTIIIDQHDVRELQLAKAAIRAGIEILLKIAGLHSNDLDRVVIAGAFGTYIAPESALVIGMLPPLPLERLHQVGNAAGTGAKSVLISLRKREEASRLISKIRYIELASSPDFMPVYIASSYLGKYFINSQNKREEFKC